MWSGFKKIFSNKKTLTPNQVIEQTLAGIQQAIHTSEASLQQARAHQEGIIKQLETSIEKAAALKEKADKLIAQGKQESARFQLQQKVSTDRQTQHYTKLNEDVQRTIHHLESQVQGLQMKYQELKSKKALVEAKLKTQQAQSEAMDQIRTATSELGFDFGSLENDMDEMASLSETLQSMSDEPDSFEATMSQIEAEDQIEAELTKAERQKEEERRLIQERKDQAAKKKLDRFFDQSQPPAKSPMHLPPNPEEKGKQKEEVNRFFEQKPETTDKSNELDEFFNSPPAPPQNPTDDFFKDKPDDPGKDGQQSKDDWKDFFKD